MPVRRVNRAFGPFLAGLDLASGVPLRGPDEEPFAAGAPSLSSRTNLPSCPPLAGVTPVAQSKGRGVFCLQGQTRSAPMHRTTKRWLMKVPSMTLVASLGVLWAWPVARYVSPEGNLLTKQQSGSSFDRDAAARGQTHGIDTRRPPSADRRDFESGLFETPSPSEPQSPAGNQASQNKDKASQDDKIRPAAGH